MIVRICPMCDSEMNKRHYCEACRSWIWKPQMLDVHFNSSSRGRGEIDCSYGEEHDAYHHMMGSDNQYYQNEQTSQKGRKKAAGARQTSARSSAARQTSVQRTAPQRPAMQSRSDRRSSAKGSPGIIILIIVIIYIIAGFLSSGILGNL